MKKLNIQEIVAQIKAIINPQELAAKIIQDKNILILMIIVVITILYLDLSFGMKSQTRAIGEIDPKITSLRKDIKDLNSDLIEMQTQRPQTGFNDVEIKRLASSTEVSWIIEEISRLANQQKVRIFYITPLRKLSAKEAHKASSPEKYSSITIDMQLSSGYFQLGRFLSGLEKHSVLFEIEELEISGGEKGLFEHKIDLKLKIYFS